MTQNSDDQQQNNPPAQVINNPPPAQVPVQDNSNVIERITKLEQNAVTKDDLNGALDSFGQSISSKMDEVVERVSTKPVQVQPPPVPVTPETPNNNPQQEPAQQPQRRSIFDRRPVV